MRRLTLFLLSISLLLPAADAGGKVERIQVHGKSLEGNLSGDSPDRYVTVYLPPSYAKEKKRRYPVIYLLHGFTDSDEKWFQHNGVKHWMNAGTQLDKAIAAGAREMIVVQPNAYTRFQGSFYSNSVTTGNWEDFVAKDLVAYVDKNYRTIPNVASRGLAGHSMGGYGTLRIGMKHPEVFSAIYAMSPCCLVASDPRQARPGGERMEAIKSAEEVNKADFYTKAAFALAAAWSPNPHNPPLFVDLPTKGGQAQASVYAKMAANAPVALIDQYVHELRQLKGIAIDIGDKDGLIGGAKAMSEALKHYDIPHSYVVYEGDHINRVAERIEKHMMPFFTEKLEAPKK